MSAHKDQYDFSRPSTSGRAGFEPFTDAGSGLHYFHFNDENGQPLLFSQGYQSPEKRDNGMDSVEKNRTIPGRVTAVEADGNFSIILRAGNNQEVARSRPYPTEELSVSVRKAVTRTETTAKSTKSVEKPAPATAAQPTETTPPAAPETASAATTAAVKTDPAARQVFKISFYQTGENEQMQGKIEHLFSNEKAAFTGLDADAMGGFMKKMVPSLDRPEAAPAMKTEPVAAPEMAGTKPIQPAAAPAEKLVEKPIEKPAAKAVDAPVFAVSNAGKVSQPQPAKRMRVLAVAKFEFTGATADTGQLNDEPAPPAPDLLGMKNAARPSVSAGQAIVNAHFRPAPADCEPSVSRKTSVIVAPAKITEPPTVFSKRPNLAIISPAMDFKQAEANFPASKMMERIIEKANSAKATVSTAPAPMAQPAARPIAQKTAATAPSTGKTMHVIGEKPAAVSATSVSATGKTTHIVGEKSPNPVLSRTAMPPAIRRVLDPGEQQPGFDRSKVAKRSVHYIG